MKQPKAKIKATKKTSPKLSRKEKRVAAKVLVETGGYSYRQVEKWLGVSKDTVWRAVKSTTPEELVQFETEFKEAVSLKKKEGLGLVLKRMQEIIPGYARLDHLVKAAEYFEGKREGSNTNVQVNVFDKAEKEADNFITEVEDGD